LTARIDFVALPTPPSQSLTPRRPGEWLRVHDLGYAALRRAGRAAILTPALFALGDKVIANPVMSYFIAFGAFAMLLFVDFGGTRLDRVRSQSLLGIACMVMIALGTLVSTVKVLAVICMFAVGFGVLFSAVVSSVIASATTPLLLAFVLPVATPGPISQIPDRVAGWGISAAVSLIAITILWPSPAAFPIEDRAIAACRALGARIRAEVAWVLSGYSDDAKLAADEARALADATIGALDKLFLGTPYRPTGLSTRARAEIRLVDELRWLSGAVLRSGFKRRTVRPDQSICDVKLAAAEVLEKAAIMLRPSDISPQAAAAELGAARGRMRDALHALESSATRLPVGQPQPDGGTAVMTMVSALDPSFRTQELAYITEQIGANVDYAAAASRRTWLQRVLGRQPSGFTGPLSSARERALAHAESSSSWLHNSVRGGAGLALAVLVADVTSVQHGFWVVFGALAVLRSNALSTGQNVARALAGTTLGFVVGGALVALIGTNSTLLWILLPFVVLFAGLAPAVISFLAGQAAFTMTLLVLFNLLNPVGWKIGLVRIEDVAIGGGVSLLMGLLFWPRGATNELSRALGRAYVDSSGYLAEAVAHAVACCDPTVGEAPPSRTLGLQAAASSRRLDDTFRGYLAERGAKTLPLAEVAALVTGVSGLRLAADAVIDLWTSDGAVPAAAGDRAAARRELLASAEHLTAWYDRFAASLTGAGDVPDPLPSDEGADGRLLDAVAADLQDGDGHANATGVRVIWTGDHLDAARRLQELLVGPARVAAAAE
jgi:Fusaric acid resistance protein-like